jgi:hypothetical protein
MLDNGEMAGLCLFSPGLQEGDTDLKELPITLVGSICVNALGLTGFVIYSAGSSFPVPTYLNRRSNGNFLATRR